jgi:hypothetical protein
VSFVGEKFGFVVATVVVPVDVLGVVPATLPMAAGSLAPVAVMLNGVPVEVALVPVLDETAVLLAAVGLAGVVGVPLVLVLARENVLLMADWPAGVAEEPLVTVFDNEKVPTTAGWLPGVDVLAPLLAALLLWPEDAFSPALVLVAAEPPASAPF